MKILHFSDTHLGFNDLEILNEHNINQREADFYDAFTQVVSAIEKVKPDFIIHTGDLFHRSSPSNRAITFALEMFKRIDALNIPTILIAGNHSTPRTNLSSPILKIFETFSNISLAYEQSYKKFSFENIIFHAIPHINDTNKALEAIATCEENIDISQKNILLMHCSAGSHYLMEEFGEWVFPKEKEYIFPKLDYVALGHWHGFGKVGKHDNVYYSGSTERTSMNDKRNNKGYIIVTLDNKNSKTNALFKFPDIAFHPITIRPIISKTLDCNAYTESLASIDTTDTKDAIVELTLKNLTPLQSIEIENFTLKALFSNALHVVIKREFIGTNPNEEMIDVEALSLEEYFLEHIKEDANEEEFTSLRTKVEALFAEYEELDDDTL